MAGMGAAAGGGADMAGGGGMKRVEWPEALRARPHRLLATGTTRVVMSVSRSADGRWQVEAEGCVIEDGFASRGSAGRYVEDRSDLGDREVRSLVARASPAQRRELRRLLDEIDDATRAP